MHSYYNQNYSREEIEDILEKIKACVSIGKYSISLNDKRQENIDFINEYNIRSDKQKSILMQIEVEDFCHSLKNTNIGYEYEVLYVFVPQVLLFNADGEGEKNFVFCEECHNDVDYTVTEELMVGKIKGVEYHYTGKEAKCACCGTRIYVPEINDFNLRTLYDVYRKKNGIVSLDIILAIPEKYSIGKRPLSLLLGWGEQTFSRYCDGDMPTKQYSEILTRIYEDPLYYAELLEAGKGNLKSQSSYEKSRKAVDELIGVSDRDSSNIDVAIKYILNQCQDYAFSTSKSFILYTGILLCIL